MLPEKRKISINTKFPQFGYTVFKVELAFSRFMLPYYIQFDPHENLRRILHKLLVVVLYFLLGLAGLGFG